MEDYQYEETDDKVTIYFKGKGSFIETKVVSKSDFIFFKEFWTYELNNSMCKCRK